MNSASMKIAAVSLLLRQVGLFLACFATSSDATTPQEVDVSVSSAIADTMAAIEGRTPPSQSLVASARHPKLGLSNMRNSEAQQHFKVKSVVVTKVSAPKQLTGYLGWAKPNQESSFSTQWNNTGANAAKRLESRNLQEDHASESTQRKAQKQALVAGVTTAFSRMLDHAGEDLEDDLPDLDWGPKARKASKSSPQTPTSDARTNSYLSSVGWKASKDMETHRENPYLQSLRR